MSADNWSICPRCNKKAKQEKADQKAKTHEGYGKVPAEEYESMLVVSRQPIKIDETLREDFEFFISPDGLFSASYRASCDRCGFKHKFNHTRQIVI